ncbi:P-loop NTPase family protein [Flexibacterium corallicola]|uniref:DnaA ATPase domain-containing protein n=1 Tax=Flexibacterium corallicola TaxID=3037259 RepID=UPI00286FAAF9|nr:DnaA/Hda family protein [Pseudovibrio sp. M1P-2-3]
MTGSAIPQQLPLMLPHNEALGFDDYLVSEANQAAFNLLTSWPNWSSPIVLLAGPTGAGKTHLVNAWQEVSGAHIVKAPQLYQFSPSELAEAGPVAIEDLHEGFDEKSLFHLFNAIRLNGQTMLLTSRTWPHAFNLQLPDLASRFRAATPIEIAEPDDMLLRMVMTKLFADRQVSVDHSLIEFLILRIERSLSAVGHIVEALDRYALAKGKKITRAMASSVLDSLDQ